MPSIKRTGVKAVEKKTGFESYDGVEPTKRGMYRAKISQANFKQFKSGSQGYVLLLEFEAAKGDPKGHAIYDGFPIWTNLVLGDKEAMLVRESNFYAALGVKDDPNVVFEDGDLEQGVKIKTIGGKKPIGLYVNADLKMGSYNGEPRPEIDGIYKLRDEAGKAKAPVAELDPDEEEDDEDEDLLDGSEEQTQEEREEELKAASLADLKEIATSDYDLDIKGLKKAGIIDAILSHEFEAAALEDDSEEEPEEDEEEPEEEELEDDEDDEELEEDEDDERAARERELAELDRNALKTVLRKVLPDYKVFKQTTDDTIREAILAEEFGDDAETPF